MKKLITLLTATIMAMSMTISTSADTILYDHPEEVLQPVFKDMSQYGFNGYYNTLYFDSNYCYYNTETGGYSMTESVGYYIIEEDGVWYMHSRRVEGEDSTTEPIWKKAPLADVLASVPRYEYKMSDMATVARFFRNEDIQINLKDAPYLDHNADGNVNSVDLSLIKYELLH
jgi:hypothetical protein